jgi:aminoglycoside 2''-phosphotransferase
MYSISEIRDSILTALPDFNIETIDCIGEGINNSAYRINNEFIFRFPKNQHAKAELISEIYLLSKLEAEVDFSLSIPHFEFFGGAALEPLKSSTGFLQKRMRSVKKIIRQIRNYPQDVQPKTFVGYKEIYGSSLTTKLMGYFSVESQHKFAQELAHFLSDLHSISIHETEVLELTVAKYKRCHAGSYKAAKKFVFPQLLINQKKLISDFFQEFMKDQKSYDYKPTLIHGDLGPEHILVEIERAQISGIIDFGGAKIGDPAYEFTFLWIDYGRDFLEALLKNYPVENFTLFLRKMKMAYLCHCIYCIVISSKTGDQKGLAEGWSALRIFLAELNNA